MYQFSDEIISQVAKLVQLAIITGTDVVDNLRMIRVQSSDANENTLVLTPEYRVVSENQIKSLLSELESANLESDEMSEE
jgi:hypothetical protein|tara:strand:+ start:311 stop:550 length:240 start_codon:yes stop_codon:yes gene_type:complete